MIVVGAGLLLVLLGVVLSGKKDSREGNSALIAKQYGMKHVDYPILRQSVTRGSVKGNRRGSTYRGQ